MTPPRRGPSTPARTPALAGVVLCVALLAGCAAPPQVALLQSDWPSGLPARTLLTRVPFIPQDDFLCGPATLAMVSQAAGRPVSAEQLTPQVYLPGRQGALQTEMLAAARRQGLVAYPLAPDLRTLLTEVAAGEPVLVLQNLSLPIAPQWHYAVAVGYDRARDEIVLHSGTTPRMPMALPTFERTWARARRWAFVVLPPEELPATAELALFHQLTPTLALHSSINWTNWSKFVQLESELDHHGTMHIKEEHWEDSWRYALGMTYQLAPQWQLRSGIAYDRSPVPADRRTISIPDSDRVWYSAGVGYQIDRHLSLDLGLTLIDGKKVDVSETMQLKPGIPQTTSTFQGTSEGDAWLAGLQLNYLF